MKISLNWLKKYVEIPKEVSDEDLIRLIGARLVEVEGVIDETHKYDNIYVVRVESCEKIPETHLSLCYIDAGMVPFRGLPEVTTEDEGASPVTTGASDPSRERNHSASIQVVCGAPNVREGMLAVWIAPGATVPASVHEDAPFVIGKRKMRGYESNGMLAGADELDFGDDHSGIVEIDPNMAKPGDLLADIFELNDKVLEIENKSLTHRPDCFGMIGFAREVAGILGLQFIAQDHLDSGELDVNSFTKLPNDITVTIDDTNICQRYSAVVLEKHGELQKKYLSWQDTMLSKAGMKPISLVVDSTNYLMLLTGQPLHAFDYDKFVSVGGEKQPKINVRLAKKGENLTLLDDSEVALNENDIVICSGDKPVALAGAMGGKSTMIDENTRNIIIESATFSLYNLRKTQMAHGIFSEAITRFTKGQPAYQTLKVAEACAGMLSQGFKAVAMADQYPKPAKQIVVKITTDEINNLLGTKYSEELIVKTLENVGFMVSRHGLIKKDNVVSITVPEWRTDIHIKEDIIEEVGRLLGYDNIAPTLPLHGTANHNKMFRLMQAIRQLMSKYGANEVLTYSFVSQNLLKRANLDPKNSYRIVNSISPELQYVRQSLVPSLLDKAYLNEKLPVDQFAIFEMNKVYRKEWGMNDENVPVQESNLGFVVAERKGKTTAFYLAKKYAELVFQEMHIDVKYVPLKNETSESLPFEKKRAAEIWTLDGEYLGVVGEFKNSVRSEFKLAPYLAGFELNLDLICEKALPIKKIEFGKKTFEDLTVETNQTYDEAKAEVLKQYPDAKILPLSVYQPDNNDTKHITFRIFK